MIGNSSKTFLLMVDSSPVRFNQQNLVVNRFLIVLIIL